MTRRYSKTKGPTKRVSLRLPEALVTRLKKESENRGLAMSYLVSRTLEREFPVPTSSAVKDLAEAVEAFVAGEARPEEVLLLADGLRGQPWYLDSSVLKFLENLPPREGEELHLKLKLLRRAFLAGKLDMRFLVAGKDMSPASRLVKAITDSGILLSKETSIATRRDAFSVLLYARRETDHLLPGVIACLVRSVEEWDDPSLFPLEEALRFPMHGSDKNTLLQRLKNLKQKGSVPRDRTTRLIQVLRLAPRLST